MNIMRTDLDHLPHGKQREIARVTEILFEEFADAMKSASSPQEEGRPHPQDRPVWLLCAWNLGGRATHGKGLSQRL